MKISHAALALVFVLPSVVLAATNSPADSSYVMQGATTDLWEPDVDYYAPPIDLHRVKNTFVVHEVNFDVLRYRQVCAQWQNVCVSHDAHGNCTSWQQQCIQYQSQTTPVHKRIELDFRGVPALADGDDEVYKLEINRVQPAGDGEDWVTTSFTDVKTKQPVKITRLGDFQYQIDLKQ